jgi:multidrug resistance efflux pump
VDLVARVEGYLRSVNFTDGTLVKAGQLLFVIEPEPYQAKLASYQAQLVGAQSEYDRQLRMIKQNATSQANVDKWQSQRDQAAAAVTLAKINLAYTRIVAPFTDASVVTWSTREPRRRHGQHHQARDDRAGEPGAHLFQRQ